MTETFERRRRLGAGTLVAGRLIAVAGAGSAAAVWISQLAVWLQQARWMPFSALDLLAWTTERAMSPEHATECLHWVRTPASWLGLHSLMEASAAPVPLLMIWLAGMLICDWGRVIRGRAERDIWDERHGFGTPRSGSQYRLSPDGRRGPVISPRSAITHVETDILRWLAVNGADHAVTTETAMARHLGRSAAEIRDGIDILIARRYVLIENGRARLAADGTTYCVDQGWTMSTALASLRGRID